MAGMFGSNYNDTKAMMDDLSNITEMYSQAAPSTDEGIMKAPKSDNVDAGSWWAWLNGLTRQKTQENLKRVQEELGGMDLSGTSPEYQQSMLEGIKQAQSYRDQWGITQSRTGNNTWSIEQGDFVIPEQPEVTVEPLDSEPMTTMDQSLMAPAGEPSPDMMSLGDEPITDPLAKAKDGIMRPPEESRPLDMGEPADLDQTIAKLPDDIKQKIEQEEPKTKKQLTQAIFDATKFSGKIATPKPGDDPLTWIAQNTYGLDETDANFQKAFKAIAGIDPSKVPWCAAFANHVLKNMGVDLPSRAKENPALAYNYIELGKEVYNHNPTTGKTYAGKLGDVRPGDIVVFNDSKRDNKGNIQYGKGHISFVVGTEEDGSIIAMGGNQGGGRYVTTTKYTPDIIKEYYKGGYTVRRIDSGALEQTDPAIIAAITKDISMGGAER